MKQRRREPAREEVDSGSGGPFLPTKLRSPATVCLLLALAVTGVYWSVSRHDFVNYDDGDYVTANAHVQQGITGANIVWAFSSGHASNWHPLTWLSHMLDCQLFGLSPGAHHLVNVAFHLINTMLVFLLLRRMTGEHWRSAFVAAIFGLHPLHVESVAWVSERKDVLSTFFLLLTLGAYAFYVQARAATARRADEPARGGENSEQNPSRASARQRVPSPSTRGPGGRESESGSVFASPSVFYVLSLLFFALGLLSKPMLVTVPFLLLLLDYWPLGRTPWSESGAVSAARPALGSLILEKLPFLLMAAVSSYVTYIVQREGGAVSVILSLGQRLGNAAISYVRYLYKAIWPADLSVLYPHPGSWPVWEVLMACLLLAGISGFVTWMVGKRPYLFVGWFWFVGMLIPVIGIVQVGIQSMADRYTYVPLIGLSIAVSWGIAELVPPSPGRGRGLAACGVIALLAFSLFTARQVEYWRDSESLFRRAVEVTPRNYLAYNNLGFYLSNHGKPLEAMECYRKSLEINPAYEDALNNMGFVLAGLKRHQEAIPYYEAALRVRPRHVEVNNNLGNALSEVGRIGEAIEHYKITLEQKPDHADAHNNLGIALAMQGKLDEAIPHFRDAIRYKTNYASAHSNLGNALAAERRWEEAIAEYRECLRLNPDDPQAHNNLANVLTMTGKSAEAVEHYEKALKLRPDNPEAHFNLGIVLAQQRKTAEARGHFEEALRLKPDYPEARRQLSILQSASPK